MPVNKGPRAIFAHFSYNVQRLRFLHIPKCAGITFVTMLRLQYLGTPRFSFSGEYNADQRRWESLTPEKKARIRLFTGHAPIETGIPEADRDVDLVTMLRDPVERVKSLCQHVSEGKSPHLVRRFPPESFDLDAFLSSGNEGLSNLQTKMLINSGRAASTDLLQSLGPEAAGELALQNLRERVTCYGVIEYFDESLALFQQRFGWRTPLYAASNRKDHRKALVFEDRHLDFIRELNRIDMKVYDTARQEFLNGMDTAGLEAGLHRLRRLQPIASPAIHALIRFGGLFRHRSP